jgi:hypothetical protein
MTRRTLRLLCILGLLVAPLVTTAQHRLAMISEVRDFAEAGGLMTYSPSGRALWRRAPWQVSGDGSPPAAG